MVATTRLGLNAQTPGTNANTWGGTLNDQVIALVDEAVAGVETIPVAGNMTLTSTNFVSNQARNFALLFAAGGLTGTATITIPGREKVYLVLNSTGRDLVFSAGGATVTLTTGRWAFIVCNGTDVLMLDPVAQAAAILAQTTAARDTAVTAAGSASGSAQTATDQAALAAAAYDSFDDRYLGAKPSDPTLDNDGNALLTGALYFNSTNNQMRVYTGSAWQAVALNTADVLMRSGGTMTGLIGLASGQYASQAEAQAGNDATRLMTPFRTAQAIVALSPVPGLVFISQQSIATAVASVDFTGLTSAYDEYIIELINVIPTALDAICMRTSPDNGASFSSADYDGVIGFAGSGSATVTRASFLNNARIYLSDVVSNNITKGGLSSAVKLVRPLSTSEQTSISSQGMYMDGNSVPAAVFTAASRKVVESNTAVRFLAASGGTLASGTFKIYGLRKS